MNRNREETCSCCLVCLCKHRKENLASSMYLDDFYMDETHNMYTIFPTTYGSSSPIANYRPFPPEDKRSIREKFNDNMKKINGTTEQDTTLSAKN